MSPWPPLRGGLFCTPDPLVGDGSPVPFSSIGTLERHRAGQGSNDHLRTQHAYAAGYAGPGGETPPLRILSIQWCMIVHPRRGRVSRPVLHDRYNVPNRAGQGKNDHIRTKHELAARTAGRRGRVSRPVLHDRYNVPNRAGQGKNDHIRTKHELAARTAGRRGRVSRPARSSLPTKSDRDNPVASFILLSAP